VQLSAVLAKNLLPFLAISGGKHMRRDSRVRLIEPLDERLVFPRVGNKDIRHGLFSPSRTG
jgi:hypothetical protein